MIPLHIQRYPAPAKLNLDLRIIGRRSDGYHLLESIFVLVDWCDEIGIAIRDDDKIILHTPLANVPNEQNLIIRAAYALQKYTHCRQGADIWIEKHIPMGGGLGGGSSDAATVLWVLNHLWQCGLNLSQLIDIGVKLGADIPFFLFGKNAFVQGIGEILQEISIPKQWYIIVNPHVHVATAEIFAHADLPRNSLSCVQPSFEHLQPFRNDMQDIVLKKYHQINEVYCTLKNYGQARITGSGACVFLDFACEEEARAVVQKLPKHWQFVCVPLLSEHPLNQKIF